MYTTSDLPHARVHSHRPIPTPIQMLLTALKTKAPNVEVLPASLQRRFDGLLQDAVHALQSDVISCPLAVALAAGRDVGETSGDGAKVDSHPDLTVANIKTVEGMFDTGIGVNAENEQICRFVRAATAEHGECGKLFYGNPLD